MAYDHAERVIEGIATGAGQLGKDGSVTLSVQAAMLNNEQTRAKLVRDVGTIFSINGFAQVRQPLLIGSGDISMIRQGYRISSLPIKFPQTDYRLPQELAELGQLLEKIIAFEQAINPHINDYYTYLTVQCTRVELGITQRGAAIHSDGIQGPRIQPKAPIERGYLIVDRFPPQFFLQVFDVTDVDPDQHLLDEIFTRQADHHLARSFPSNSIVAFDSYAVHQALPATESCWRSFVRLAYSTRQYDRLGNTINAAFLNEYQQHGWQFQPRPLPQLARPPMYA